ncbi:Ribonuclease H2 subunit A [Irineochytrium annulatum]|nr:Ribonuclease H2 subunit A [Irineochytrium annulatum]
MRSLIVYGIPREIRNEVDLAAYFESLGIGSVENVVICRKWNKLRSAVSNRAYYLQQLERVFFHVRKAVATKRADSKFGSWFLKRSGSSNLSESHNGVGRSGSAEQLNGDRADERLIHGWDSLDNHGTFVTATSPLIDRRRFSASDPNNDPSLFEIMNFLDAVNPSLRPTHKTGFMGLFGEQVDSADYYAEKYKEADHIVHDLRKIPERSPPTAIGFVTFESPESATIAAQVILARRPFACMAKIAPEPRDVYWPNLSSSVADTSMKVLRSLVVNTVLIGIIFASTAFIGFLSGVILSNVDADKLPILRDFFARLGKPLNDFLKEVVFVVLFNAWTSSLPSLLIVLSQLQGLEAVSWIEMSLYSKYFYYLLYNILLVPVGTSIWKKVVASEPFDFIDLLAINLPRTAPVFMGWVILQASAINPAQLLLVGSHMLPFCAAFFAIAYFIHKYFLLYVHLPRYETGGMYAPMAVRRCLAGIVIMQLMMMGVLAITSGKPASESGETPFVEDEPLKIPAYVQMVVGVVPLLFISLALFWWFKEGYDPLIRNAPMEVVGKVVRDLTRRDERANGSVHSDVAGGARPGNLEGDDIGQLGHGLSPLAQRRGLKVGRGRHRVGLLSYENGDGDTLIRRGTLMGTEMQSPVPTASSLRDDQSEDGLNPNQNTEGVGAVGRGTAPVSPSQRSFASFVPSEAGRNGGLSLFDDPVENEESSRDEHTGFRHSSPQANPDLEANGGGGQMSDSEDYISYSLTLEPPSTRVPGILDAPLQSALIQEGDEDVNMLRSIEHGNPLDAPDLQVHTYIHPALIGRLPVAWLPSSKVSQQPRRLREAREEQVAVGVDEAGRGPVLGPMVYGVAYAPLSKLAEVKATGVDDSKKLTESDRDNLFSNLAYGAADWIGWGVTPISPRDISNGMLRRSKYNLNQQAYDTTVNLVRHLIKKGVQVAEVYVDTVGKEKTYEAYLSDKFPGVQVTVRKKADSLYPIVSAASIFAKVTRDFMMAHWRFSEAASTAEAISRELGSGYPGGFAAIALGNN